ncbi:kinase-like protein [Auriscalpium vulgare]|uniref:Kinase-like protein n=1 Tax=Auriscalpium vulgare TaxID=40419 RepID=A0ACB8RPQ9_9AGAM|nr:kinase-like protein [Auriscalpium vulgare]
MFLSAAPRAAETNFPEENLLLNVPEGHGFFLTRPGALLKDGRYKVIRKLGRGRCSSTFLVEDVSPRHDLKYLAVKVLFVSSTIALEKGIIQELDVLQVVKDARSGPGGCYVPLPNLVDHFALRGPHGVHYCFVTLPLRSDIHAYRATAPTGRLSVHIVRPIICDALEAVRFLHARDIIHAGMWPLRSHSHLILVECCVDIKADNVLFSGPSTSEIEEIIAKEPPVIDGTFEFEGKQYPIMRSQPFPSRMPWDSSPFDAETIATVLSDLGSALFLNKPMPSGDIGAFALRAPENVIRAECGKAIDIWAIGCMTYELLSGQILFQPTPSDDLTPDESLLLLQYSLTGETLNKELVEQSRVREQYFDDEGELCLLRHIRA